MILLGIAPRVPPGTPDSLVAAQINATVLTIFVAFAVLYVGRIVTVMNELRSQLLDAIEPINQFGTENFAGDMGTADFGTAAGRQTLRFELGDNIRPAGRYQPTPKERGAAIVGRLTTLFKVEPLPTRIERNESGGWKSVMGGMRPVRKTTVAEARSWLDELDLVVTMVDFLRRERGNVDDALAALNPDDPYMGREMTDVCLEQLGGLRDCGLVCRARLRRYDVEAQRLPTRCTAVAIALVTGAAFACGVIGPLLAPHVSWRVYALVPAAVYVVLLALVIVTATRIEVRPGTPPAA